MKRLRIWLLVLLAVLLPVRVAMAAAMLCPPVTSSHSHGQAHMGSHHGHDEAADHHPAAHDVGDAQHHHDGAGQHKCSLCASCCSMVPLMSTVADFPQPFHAAERFPELSVPAPSFVSDGQERPPRSI